MNIKMLGIALSKSAFQLHGVNDFENPILKKKLSRKEENWGAKRVSRPVELPH